jgi:hypothetical protein
MRAPQVVVRDELAGEAARYPPEPPPLPGPAVQVHRWEHLSFLHWPYAPEVVQRLLPPGLRVDTHQGSAWVGLIPFRLRITVPGVPALPWAGRFIETNVRTYVRAADGTPGIWFLSLDAARLGAVALARTAWALPYMWAEMALTRAHDTVVYESRRRWPCRADATSRVVLRVGERYEQAELTPLDHFLTARWWLFSPYHGGLARTRAHHPAWPLRRASVVEIDDGLLVAADLPSPQGAPLVHHCEGVDVRLSRRMPC